MKRRVIAAWDGFCELNDRATDLLADLLSRLAKRWGTLAALAALVAFAAVAVTLSPSMSRQNGFLQSGTGATLQTIEAELRQIITPKQFGAVCDGVTNDSAAMDLAVTAAGTSTTSKTVIIWSNCVGTYTQPVNGVRVLDFRRGSGSGPVLNSAAVEVRAYATGGAGTVGNPWTGWDTAITWTANTYYFLSSGVYAYTTAPNWALTGLRIVGEFGEPVLQFNGTGNAVLLDGGATGGGIYDVQIENVTISGTATATNGIYARSLHHSVLRNVRVKNVSAACLRMEWTVVDTIDTFRCSVNEGAFSPTPVNCIYLDKRTSDSLAASANTFINPICEGMSGSGIKLVAAAQNLFLDGTSEGNGRGIELLATSDRNTFQGLDMESNSTEDALVNSAFNSLVGVLSTGTVHFGGAAASNAVLSGYYNAITVDAGATLNRFETAYSATGGAFTDNGTDTSIKYLYNITTAKQDGIPWTYRDTIPSIGWSGLGLPDKQDFLAGTYKFTTSATTISNTVLTASAPWRVLFIGAWMNNTEGSGLNQLAPIIEATTAAPTITVGSITLTVAKNGSNQLQATTSANTVGFSGRVIVLSQAVGGAAGTAGSAALSLKGSITAGQVTATGATGAGTVTGDSFRVAATNGGGTITLSTGSGTATVFSGARCVCTDTTANASVKCAVATTTLTATGTGSDVISYFCF